MLLEQGVADGVYPLARAVVLYRGELVYEGGNATPATIFDCASVTKVMSTTALALAFLEKGLLQLDTKVGAFTVEDLLYHRAGLEPFRPYFASFMERHPKLREELCPPALRASVRAQLLEAVYATPAVRPPKQAAVYSDLGFILLGDALEKAGGAALDELFARHVAAPLGLAARYRRLSAELVEDVRIAPTGATRPREPAPGQEGLWRLDERPSPPGEVDDDNAWCLDGVSGHAGLFATARDIAQFGQAVLEGRFRPVKPWAKDVETPGSTRALGFDTPSDTDASCGPRFGRAGLQGAIGHLGFTGMSLWLDLDRELVVVLATNRVALGRANLRIKAFRPRFHDAVLDALT